MKAAVLHAFGETPRYVDFPDPVAEGEEMVVPVRAVALKNIDRGRASGVHYDKHTLLPAVVGVDGIVVMPDGSRVYSGMPRAPYGMMAQLAPVGPRFRIPVPNGVDDATATALPNAAMSSWLALKERASLVPGQTVLVMGATGASGKLAVQVAKHLGAGRVVAVGRNETVLASMLDQGADAIVPLDRSAAEVVRALREAQGEGYDVVLDYLWGPPMELLLQALMGHDLNAVPHHTRIVQIGEMAGASIQLRGGVLRSSAIEMVGSGGGSVRPAAIMAAIGEIFNLAAQGLFTIDTVSVPLSEVESAWKRPAHDGKRVVLVP